MDIEQKAKRSKSLLENDWFIQTMKDLREEQKNVFADSAPQEVEEREKAYSILCALNLIEGQLQSHVDILKLATKKGKHRVHD